ncbi:MAG TPA: cytochrome c oxidase accessory protein CcoG [Kofleriaceae bacterium]|nr:cytochrome c oxidase accessory protein CcoG [Kofleriaceae bacterium]
MTHEVPTDRVLSTLNRDGTRRWIRPKLAHGRFLRRRRVVGYLLIALFVLLPRLRIAGRPGVLIDLGAREIDVLGAVFRPSDGFVLALLGVTIVAGVFLLTALWGRVWCGWGCPQTVYLEHVFRPIERWLEGSRGQRASRTRKAIKWGLFAAVAFALSNVFLAYFVGTDRLERWVFESPLQHPGGFALVVSVAALMLLDFGWFREQMCIVACPYGRLQSVLLDRQSLIIGYDTGRGEPRSKPKKKLLPVVASGDCVDCAACVAVCPTGIDIRDGLQMECIGCAQCIDACDTVMTKLGRDRGLIRYTSQDELAGKPARVLRARTIAYPLLFVIASGLLAWTVRGRTGSEFAIEREEGPSFVELPDGKVSAQVRLRIENDTDAPRRYMLALAGAGATLRSQALYEVKPHKSLDVPLFVDVPRTSFVHGKRQVYLQIHDSNGAERTMPVTLLGPEGDAR